ncbi:unnamed protein product [Lymnaea stagnalis]|uniref:Cilia- and flagella-associated protein 418 n=1 Tax=Lymnaea stagnalis TaxID=6523 RepID=A0AAV2HU97_LYMST
MMDKDIDELLDEVETKFVKPGSKDRMESTKSSRLNTSEKKSSALDAVINDILDIEVEKKDLNSSYDRNQLRSSLSDEANKCEHGRRCFPVFLGGSSDETGLGSSINRRSCDRLRCTSCDFRVCFFDNLSWSKDTDYLFLRNNVPELQKLKSKLSRKKGCRAYCCQCSWRNVQEPCELNDPNLKWVCGKHVS